MRRFFVIAFALVASIGLDAKGATVKLTITGPGLTAPIEIVEPAILAGSNVFAGSFIGGPGAARRVTASTWAPSCGTGRTATGTGRRPRGGSALAKYLP